MNNIENDLNEIAKIMTEHSKEIADDLKVRKSAQFICEGKDAGIFYILTRHDAKDGTAEKEALRIIKNNVGSEKEENEKV